MNFDLSSLNICACMGPQDGEPVCPCAMQYIKIIDGRYISANGEDLGLVGKRMRSYVDDLKKEDACEDINHNPNIDMVRDLPLDKVYVHICRSCKAEFRLMPNFAREFFRKLFEEEKLDK